jgi:hypothetical protein
MAEDIEWAEELPVDCPPVDALEPNNDPFFRLVGSIPPRNEDFWSQRKLYPLKNFHANECIARSCSLISTLERCSELVKLPAQKNKRIVKLVLSPGSGCIKKTGGDATHYSWWRNKELDPIPACVEVFS